MDPLSIAGSAIAVATLAGQICKHFHKLRELYKELPGRLQALSNEVTDIQAVCQQVTKTLKSRPIPASGNDAYTRQLLRQADIKLKEVQAVIEKIAAACDSTRGRYFAVTAWKKEQTRLQLLQEEIRTIKVSLNIMLGLSNSRDVGRIHFDIESITSFTTQAARVQKETRIELIEGLNRHYLGMEESVALSYDKVDQRISRVEDLLQAQAERYQQSSQSLYNPPHGPAYPYHLRRRSRNTSREDVIVPQHKPESLRVRVAQYVSECSPRCLCACHSPNRITTPEMLQGILGRAFVGYAGLPFFNAKCDHGGCRKAQSPQLSMEYWFPLGVFWSQIVRLSVSKYTGVGPQMSLDFLRQVPDTCQVVDYALGGNIDGLKDLFRRGVASPRDVSKTRGYSVLRWAVYGKQWETAKFLVHQGADPVYRPISAYDNSPRNKVWDFVLQGFLPTETVEALQCLTSGTDWVDEQNFTKMHNIATGLYLSDLEAEIALNPQDIHVKDSLGRTPLQWAAARGDTQAVGLLLAAGADPDTLDVQLTGPVSYAAERGHVVCVRLLLEAGAQPDPVLPAGIKVGSPLNCASRNSPDVMVLKNLLDFGADTEATGSDGKTALIHVSRTDNVQFATLLLEYGANINASTKDGQTPLTTAVTYNSHGVLRLLLERWMEYSVCPRLQGPCLMNIAANFADVETLRMLTVTDHIKLKYDQGYPRQDYSLVVGNRFDATAELAEAFDGLLYIVKQGPTIEKIVDLHDLSEMGLMPYTDAGSEKSDTDGSEIVYEDAYEQYPNECEKEIDLIKS